jgi:hypothetical protein
VVRRELVPEEGAAGILARSAASCVASGSGIRESEPRNRSGQYVPSPAVALVGSARFGPIPSPFMFVTNSVPLRGSNATASGYHAVGM